MLATYLFVKLTEIFQVYLVSLTQMTISLLKLFYLPAEKKTYFKTKRAGSEVFLIRLFLLLVEIFTKESKLNVVNVGYLPTCKIDGNIPSVFSLFNSNDNFSVKIILSSC